MFQVVTKNTGNHLAEDILLPYSSKKELTVWWLGQAGFAFRYGKTRILIDPYLSDSLAKKYRSTEFPHTRMIAPPLTPFEVNSIDYVICTHRHTDHMDAETILPIIDNNPDCKLLFPKAWEQYVLNFGVSKEVLIPIENDESIQLTPDIRISAIPSAHESLDRDEHGNYLYLGYVLDFNNITLYHSGDCIPYKGLSEGLKQHQINIAFLPVNGRDAFRKSRGVPGNFTYEEAVELCSDAKMAYMIPHHFGMFDFNTVPINELRAKANSLKTNDIVTLIPELNKKFCITNFISH